MIILSIILGLIFMACFIYSMFAFHEKGPILMNDYLLATKEEKLKMKFRSPDKMKRDYRVVAIIFLWTSILVFLILLSVILKIFEIKENILLPAVIILGIALCVYAVVQSAKDGNFR